MLMCVWWLLGRWLAGVSVCVCGKGVRADVVGDVVSVVRLCVPPM